MPDVILPVLNEVAALPGVLARLPDGYRPIVVDNGSTDNSAAVAQQCGATVVHEAQRGFGAACYAGLLAATADVVCFMDCDGSFDARELPKVADPVTAGTVDLMLGFRVPTTSGAWPLHARVANRALALFMRRSAHIQVTDLGPMRAARRTALLELGIADRRFGWPLEMVLRASQQNWRIAEVAVSYAPRIGVSKVTGTVKGTLRAIKDMSRVAKELR